MQENKKTQMIKLQRKLSMKITQVQKWRYKWWIIHQWRDGTICTHTLYARGNNAYEIEDQNTIYIASVSIA